VTAPPSNWSALPGVTVIVPVHGSRGELTATLDALSEQQYGGDVQVVVVDNGDNEDLPRAEGSALVVSEPVRSSYAARNRGAAQAVGSVLAFTDADCRPRPDWLANGVTLLRAQAGPAFVGGHIEMEFQPGERPTGAGLYDSLHGLQQARYVTRDRYAATANAFVSHEVFAAVGPFDSSLQSGGDRDWGERAAAAGVRPVYGPEVVVRHPVRNSLAEVQRKILRLHRGWASAQRDRGEAVFTWAELLERLYPHSRSILRASRRLRRQGHRRVDCLRYAAVAHWLQYFSLYAWVRAGLEVRDR